MERTERDSSAKEVRVSEGSNGVDGGVERNVVVGHFAQNLHARGESQHFGAFARREARDQRFGGRFGIGQTGFRRAC
jgi:hypothetical protein